MAVEAGDESNALFDYTQTVPHALECPICRSPLANPVQTPACQHLFCRACLARSLTLARSCPIDRSPLDSVNDCQPAPRAVRELLDDLSVRCMLGSGSCGKEMRRDEWDRHALACGKRDEEDGAKAALKAQAEGTKGENAAEDAAATRTERCELCDADIPSPEVPTHASTCPSSRRPCTHCSLNLPLPSHPSHLLNSCPSVPLPCPHASHGCPYTGPRTQLYDDHLPTECAYEPLKAYLEQQDRRTRELEGENWELKQRVGVLEGRLESVERLLEGMRKGMGEYFPADDKLSASTSTKPSAPASSPSLSSTLSALSTQSTTLSSTLSSLSHSHHQHLSTTHHLVDELAALRAGLAGVRIQVGGVMMEMQRVAASGGGGGMMLGRRAGEAEGEEGEAGGPAVTSGQGASFPPPFFRSRTMPYPPPSHAQMYGGPPGLDYAGGIGAQGARGVYGAMYGIGVGGAGMGPLSPGGMGGAGVKL
ncbi:hypothetical protein JCM10296v2_004436 [Rhodotorula toruloides]